MSMYEKKIPELLSFLLRNGHKGERGRVGVIGGCELYTGNGIFDDDIIYAHAKLTVYKLYIPFERAPYYAAMASLRSGGELATVFTSPAAAMPIKTYSPELMVVPQYGKGSLSSPQGDFALKISRLNLIFP